MCHLPLSHCRPYGLISDHDYQPHTASIKRTCFLPDPSEPVEVAAALWVQGLSSGKRRSLTSDRSHPDTSGDLTKIGFVSHQKKSHAQNLPNESPEGGLGGISAHAYCRNGSASGAGSHPGGSASGPGRALVGGMVSAIISAVHTMMPA